MRCCCVSDASYSTFYSLNRRDLSRVEQPTEDQLEEVCIRHVHIILLLLQLQNFYNDAHAGERDQLDGWRRHGEHGHAGALAQSIGAGQCEAPDDAVTEMLMLK